MNTSPFLIVKPKALYYILLCSAPAFFIALFSFVQVQPVSARYVIIAISFLASIIVVVCLLTYSVVIDENTLVYKTILKKVTILREDIQYTKSTKIDRGRQGTSYYFDIFVKNMDIRKLRISISSFSSKDISKLAETLGIEKYSFPPF